MAMDDPGCHCLTPPVDDRDYEQEELGIDDATGRFAEVRLDRCHQCSRIWLSYQYEREAFTRSGRWYRGVITEEQAKVVTAESALGTLAGLPWYLYGGSYFETSGKRSDEPLDPDAI